MDSIFKVKNYREVVEFRLRGGRGPRRKGVNALAKAMRCHPTFLAKVLGGRADFSMEQALAFAEFYAFPDIESQFFVDLVQLSRASDQRTKRFFELRLDSMRQTKLELSQRLGGKFQPLPEIQNEYYNSWIPQYVHIACQTEGRHSVKSLAEQLHLSESVIDAAVRLLIRGGILIEERGELRSTVDFMHLPSQSYLVAGMHQQWRMKVASDISRQKMGKAIHFSGLMSIDKAAAGKIRELLTTSITNIKPIVTAAPSKDVYLLALDFYDPA